MSTLVCDASGKEIALPSLWLDRRCVVVFLRHFGCRFCKQHTSLVKAMKAEYDAKAADAQEERVSFVLVSIGAPSHIEKFRQDSGWDGEVYVVKDVKDTQSGAYGIFSLAEGGDRVMHPKVMGPSGLGQAAINQGFVDGGYPHPEGGYRTENGWESKPEWSGNVHQLGGVFVLGPGNMCDYSYRSDYAGDFPDAADILKLIAPASEAELVAESTSMWAEKLGCLCPHKVLSSRKLDGSSLPWRDIMSMGALGIAMAGLARRNWLLGVGGTATALALQIPRLVPARPDEVGKRRASSFSWDPESEIADLKLLTPRQVDAEIMSRPGGIACDCGYVPRIEMERNRTGSDASEACNEVGCLPLDQDLEVLATTLCYVREFLAKPHPVVGRGGPVCPFIPKTLKTDCIYLAVLRVTTADEVERVCMAARSKFKDLKPNSGNMKFFRAVVLVFPDIDVKDAYRIIDGTQDKLKDVFVKDGLMLGEFHLLNNSPGLRNPEFYPLRTPYPSLAMRHMVPSDLPFLKAKPLWTKAYLEQFDSAENFAKAKEDLRKEAELSLCN